jgi:glutathione S-transferase
MSKYKLTYFDFDGGRGEPLRIALHAAGIPFEDERWSFPEFGEQRASLRFNAVPSMHIDGKQFTQSNAMSRYIGKMAGLYPEDPLQALYCDEVLDALEDLNHYVVQTFGLQGDALKEARQQLMDGRLTVFLRGLNELLQRGGGIWFADQKLTIADLKMYVQMKSLRSGNLDHIPADFADDLAPELAQHFERTENEAIVRAYYATRAGTS